jgi:UDP-N-acetyl-2-amino-2-deoxyglucuronate dehydrogenase
MQTDTQERPYRIGLIGCGRISQYHFDAIEKVEGLQVAAVCDVDESRARAAGQKLGVPWFTSAEKLVQQKDVDLVTVCSWSGLHPEHGILAANAGKHVIVEKPMALSMESAEALVNACDVAGVRLFVVKQNRLNPPIRLLKNAVDLGRFGRIFAANVTVRWQRPQEYYDAEKWRGTWKYDGGAIMNQASHYVDLVQWLVGQSPA